MTATQTPSPSLFFTTVDGAASAAVSQADASVVSTIQAPSRTEPQLIPSGSTSSPLFFEDSEDETPRAGDSNEYPPSSPHENPIGDIVDLDFPVIEPRVSSTTSIHSQGVPSSRASSMSLDETFTKKRKLGRESLEKPGPEHTFTTAYLGSFIVPRAWSTVRGKGYTRVGDIVLLERDCPDDDPPSKKTIPKAKPTKDSKSKGGKKQLSIATMLKPPPIKFTKRKKDTVVRLTNVGGFGALFSKSRASESNRFLQNLVAYPRKLPPGFQDCWILV